MQLWLVLSLLVSSVLGSAVRPGHRVLLTEEWQPTGHAADASAAHIIVLALQEDVAQLAALRRLFDEVHDPTHPSWLQHLSASDMHVRIGVGEAVVHVITRWLTEQGGVPLANISWQPSGANIITVHTTVAAINTLFNTSLGVWQHRTRTSVTTVRPTLPYFLQAAVRPYIEFVDGLSFMPDSANRMYARHSKPATYRANPISAPFNSSASSPQHRFQARQVLDEEWLVPVQSLYQYYGVPDRSGSLDASLSPDTSIELLELWTGSSSAPVMNSFSPNDLAIYNKLWASSPQSPALNIPASRVIGPNNAGSPTGEASLDVQAALSINPLPSATFEITTAFSESYFGWAVSFQQRVTLPQVVSISYGTPEVAFLPVSGQPASSTVDGIPIYTYLDRTNTELMKIGLRGTSVLVSSGDTGANGINTKCQYPYENVAGLYLLPSFPATSPYVTTVGATDFFGDWHSLQGSTAPFCSGLTSAYQAFASFGLLPYSGGPHTGFVCYDGVSGFEAPATTQGDGATGFSSGGGFSAHFAPLAFQQPFITDYLSSAGLPVAGFFNPTGRAYPDVSMFGGTEFPVVVDAQLEQIGGTSLSSPLLGGIVALLNEQSMAARGQSLGFVAPLLYQMSRDDPICFIDIEQGNNRCPTSAQAELTNCGDCTGYPAVAGWDAVTGLGSPRVSAMQAQLARYLAAVPAASSSSGSSAVPSVSSSDSSSLSTGALVAIVVVAGWVVLTGCMLTALYLWCRSVRGSPLRADLQQTQHEMVAPAVGSRALPVDIEGERAGTEL